MIALIDYKAGNLTSVKKALATIGAEVSVPETPDDLADAAGIIVPGVGHFGATRALDQPWIDAILARVGERFDVARKARKLNPELQVVYITGHAAHLDKFGVPDAVMFPKPFYPDELADQVVDMLGGQDPVTPAAR